MRRTFTLIEILFSIPIGKCIRGFWYIVCFLIGHKLKGFDYLLGKYCKRCNRRFFAEDEI